MMLIVLMAWLYVVLMLAVAQDSVAAGLAVGFLLGVLPTWFVAWVVRNKLRRRRAEREQGRKA
ncbi:MULTISPECIES: ATP synthase subunit I [Chromobacterium]|nr:MULTISPECIES: ATP synthase subunit I [Chromobacterium]